MSVETMQSAQVEEFAYAWFSYTSATGPRDYQPGSPDDPYVRTAELLEEKSLRKEKLVEDIEAQRAKYVSVSDASLDAWAEEARLFAASAAYIRKVGGLTLQLVTSEEDEAPELADEEVESAA